MRTLLFRAYRFIKIFTFNKDTTSFTVRNIRNSTKALVFLKQIEKKERRRREKVIYIEV